jgi:hypothetical protein
MQSIFIKDTDISLPKSGENKEINLEKKEENSDKKFSFTTLFNFTKKVVSRSMLYMLFIGLSLALQRTGNFLKNEETITKAENLFSGI